MSFYLLYYLVVFLLLTIKNFRLSAFVFSLSWFVFVGLRFENGVDWFTTLAMFSRTIENSESFFSLFQNYNLVDSEIFYKILAVIFYNVIVDDIWFFFTIAVIEAIVIFKIILNSYNPKLTIIVIASLFTLHFGFNAVRQGFALILYVAAVCIPSNRVFNLYMFGAITAHWASLPLILIDFVIRKIKFTLKNITIFAFSLFVIFTSLVNIIPVELIDSRFSGGIGQYETSGLGLKFIFSTICTSFLIYKIRPTCYKEMIVIEILLFISAITFTPSMRYFLFYTYFSVIYLSTRNIKSFNVKLLLVVFAFILLLFEWQEILRFNSCINCGDWFPYKNIINTKG